MLSNVLRVLLMKVTTRHMEKRSRKYQKLHEDELGAYYCARPMMAKEIAGNARAFLPIFFIMVLVAVVFGGLAIAEEIKTGKIDFNRNLCEVIESIVLCGIVIFYISSIHRYERTKCLFRNKDICIKRYLHKDKIVTYEEVKQCLRERKLRVHNGNFEYPYKGGVIKIHTADGSLPEEFYRFMNQRCGWKMPRVSKKDKAVVRRTGLGRAIFMGFGMFFLLFEIFGVSLAVVGDYGIDHTSTEIKAFIWNLIVSPRDNIFLLIACFFLALGVILHIVYYFMAKYHFRSWDGVKVTLF
jgi:hypothetical protein